MTKQTDAQHYATAQVVSDTGK